MPVLRVGTGKLAVNGTVKLPVDAVYAHGPARRSRSKLPTIRPS